MTHRRVHTALLGVVLAIVGVQLALAQDEPRLSLSTSVDYSVGDYGTGKDTALVYVPFTLGVRPFDHFWLNLTVPYLYQTGQNIVLTGGGVAVKGKKSNGKLTQPATSTTESGLGDVLAKASLIVIEEKEFIPEITPYFKVKFPTADEDRGLGTGEFDETLGRREQAPDRQPVRVPRTRLYVYRRAPGDDAPQLLRLERGRRVCARPTLRRLRVPRWGHGHCAWPGRSARHTGRCRVQTHEGAEADRGGHARVDQWIRGLGLLRYPHASLLERRGLSL